MRDLSFWICIAWGIIWMAYKDYSAAAAWIAAGMVITNLPKDRVS